MSRRAIDLTGQRFGRLVAIETTERPMYTTNQCRYWLCRCDCGNYVDLPTNVLRHGVTRSCGCLRREVSSAVAKASNGHRTKFKPEDMFGRRFGRLVVIDIADKPEERKTRGHWWLCKCDCGNEVVLPTGSLTSGNTRSCGCLNAEWGRKHMAEINAKKAGQKND